MFSSGLPTLSTMFCHCPVLMSFHRAIVCICWMMEAIMLRDEKKPNKATSGAH